MPRSTKQPPTDAKQHGVHYTPEKLSHFLAKQISEVFPDQDVVTVCDPACGDGSLLEAMANQLRESSTANVELYGYDRDPVAATAARQRLANLNVQSVEITSEDFLELAGIDDSESGTPLGDPDEPTRQFDVIISNPPYVRTQVLGSNESRKLAKRFSISGRVDLYHAFTIGMTNLLKEGGVIGLLTSNRFLSVKSGKTMRHYLRKNYELLRLFDLGDTKLFEAAVLPAILIAKRQNCGSASRCKFTRVYEDESPQQTKRKESPRHFLDVVASRSRVKSHSFDGRRFTIQRGTLRLTGKDEVWSLHNKANARWLSAVESHSVLRFADIAAIKVGVKTTADKIFIRRDWQEIAPKLRPEKELLHPLVTHHDTCRWALDSATTKKTILYPYEPESEQRVAITLSNYPFARRYFAEHEQQLRRRTYVTEGGREWFEIWVAHKPIEWSKPKIVFPDISEKAQFSLDLSGKIVNGDCYWMTLKPDIAEDYLYLIMAVANSSFAEQYYDTQFCNKLYSGRRRFMTQYVADFPLPDLATELAVEIVRMVKGLVDGNRDQCAESEIDNLVSKSFGLLT